jgi:glucose-1-phosphatase
MTSDPRRPFLYFDMGNVLLMFSHERMAAQMAAVAGITRERAWNILFERDLGIRHETGLLTTDQFYDEFLKLAGVDAERVDRAALDLAANDIFWLNTPMVALVGRLNSAGYRLGILSNTNAGHWEYILERFAYARQMFHVHAMSFNIHAMKPDPRIYAEAAKLAGVTPKEAFFTDDRPENVVGAKAAGYDAILFTSPDDLSRELWRRGIVANY